MSKQAGNTGWKWILYILIQWTFGLLQNLLGAGVFLYCLWKNPKMKVQRYHGAILAVWHRKSTSMGLGMFIFFGHTSKNEAFEERIRVHEFGHTIQSCLLGPLFLPVIGLPSLLWANLPVCRRKWMPIPETYYRFYPEAWADHLGRRFITQRMI